jgi:hypothetical protein
MKRSSPELLAMLGLIGAEKYLSLTGDPRSTWTPEQKQAKREQNLARYARLREKLR